MKDYNKKKIMVAMIQENIEKRWKGNYNNKIFEWFEPRDNKCHVITTLYRIRRHGTYDYECRMITQEEGKFKVKLNSSLFSS
jgi:hypothetical protein